MPNQSRPTFYRRKYDAAKTLAAFGVQIRSETDLATLTERMVEMVNETIEPAGVTLWLKRRICAACRPNA